MDKYHVLELIGEGQFGKVYKGRRKFGSQTVALKFIGKKGKSEKELAALRQEMHILASLTGCAYVIRMLDWFETASEICVVTEYAQGELFEILEDDTALPEETVKRIAVQLVAGLRYLHAHRIIHRDMKPQNILIGACGTLKVADFGFARSMSANTSLLTSVKGTPLYMAPELVRSMPYNHTTDLWSLGVILYELAVGQPPFFTNSFYTLVHLIVDTAVVYPPTMSAEFKSFLQGLLHKSPSKRLTWPELQSHPFIRETPEEEQRRTDAANKGNGSITMLRPISAAGGASMPPSARSTPRTDGQQPAGLGGAALPPKPQTASQASAASGHPPPHPAQPASRSSSQTARANSAAAASTSVAAAAAAAPKTDATVAAAAVPPSSNTGGMEGGYESETRSRSGSAELDLRQLPQLLSPAYASSLPNTLQQLTALLQRASSSPQQPSPLLDVYPTLLEQQVPSQLCRLLVGAAAGSHSPTIEYPALLPLVLQALVAMLQPSGGRVAPMPLYATDAEGSGAANAAAPNAGGRSSLRAAAGRAPPNYELQLRRQLAECICVPEGPASGVNHGAFSLLAAATRAACKETAVVLSTRGEPSALLSSLVVVLFQCTRACVANGTAAAAASAGAAAAGGAAAAAAAASAAGGNLLDCLAGDVPLLTSLLSTLHACASGLGSNEVSARARLAGRLLLFFANLCGKHPAVVKVLVQQCGFDAAAVLAHMRPDAAPMLALPASFLLSQLLTNPHARLEAHVARPLPLLQLVAHWLQTPAMPANIPGAGAPHTLLVELEGSGVGYSLIGSHDGLLQLLQALVYFHQLQSTTPKAVLIAKDAIAPSEQFLTGTVWTLLLARLERLDQQQQQRTSGAAHPGSNGASGGGGGGAALDVHATGELSVLGWLSFLSLMLDLLKMHSRMGAARAGKGGDASSASEQSAAGSGSLMSESLFRSMCALLSPVRVGALYAWPEACGGGSVGVAQLLKRALGILYVPFTLRCSARDEEVLQARVQKCLFNTAFIRRLLSACRLLELPAQLEAPLGFLAHLTMRNENFEKQMLENGGLALLANKQLLNPAPRVAMVPATNGAAGVAAGGSSSGVGGGPALVRVNVVPSATLLTDALNIVSHLARSSAAHYAHIHSANLYASLRALLSHADGGVRAKTCNLLGNLCRHSAFFYPHLAAADLVSPLVERCSDPDPTVRKWAAFALGNAVFHDASLCPLVVPAIPALLLLLRTLADPAAAAGSGGGSSGSDRTTQNAAGVLTNMLRHGVAAHEMIEQGAVETLLDLLIDACEDEQGRPRQQPTPLQVQSARSALFTLGDLAAFRTARRILQQQQGIESAQRVAAASNDPKLHTYCQRLLAKYNAQPQG